MNRPQLVLLDEMTTGPDPAARHEAWRLVERMRERGTTVVLVTDVLDEAERPCDRHLHHAGGRRRARGRARRGRRRSPRSLGGGAGSAQALLHLGHALVERGVVPDDLRVHQPTLENAYFRLVGRDDGEGADDPDVTGEWTAR